MTQAGEDVVDLSQRLVPHSLDERLAELIGEDDGDLVCIRHSARRIGNEKSAKASFASGLMDATQVEKLSFQIELDGRGDQCVRVKAIGMIECVHGELSDDPRNPSLSIPTPAPIPVCLLVGSCPTQCFQLLDDGSPCVVYVQLRQIRQAHGLAGETVGRWHELNVIRRPRRNDDHGDPVVDGGTCCLQDRHDPTDGIGPTRLARLSGRAAQSMSMTSYPRLPGPRRRPCRTAGAIGDRPPRCWRSRSRRSGSCLRTPPSGPQSRSPRLMPSARRFAGWWGPKPARGPIARRRSRFRRRYPGRARA